MNKLFWITIFLSLNIFAKEKRDDQNQIIYIDTHDDYAHANMTIPMRNSNSRYKFDYFRVFRNEKKIALTFDCAEFNESNAIDILDSLKKYNIKATFFIAGAFIYKKEILGFSDSNLRIENFKLIKRIIDEGHDIGNH
ncbi:MAG: polysaccharide deacetylase family protein [Bacteriovoracaceae bacterium]